MPDWQPEETAKGRRLARTGRYWHQQAQDTAAATDCWLQGHTASSVRIQAYCRNRSFAWSSQPEKAAAGQQLLDQD